MDHDHRPPHRPRRHGPHRLRWVVLGALILLALAGCAIMYRPAIEPRPGAQSPAAAQAFDAATVERGRQLAALGSCAACHTVDPARPYAGGLALATSFGTVYSTNITPDTRTGIGAWTEQAFARALREGVSRDGHLLYPAFPYDYYTHMKADDVHALYAYLMTRPALDAPAHGNSLHFPFGFRPLVAFWNVLYLKKDDAWAADPRQSVEWNRGAYLADAVAHCGACHTPRTKLGGTDTKRFLDGGEAEGWYVPALNAHSPSPLPWTTEQLASYLRTGIAADHAAAGGPMQSVVENLRFADQRDVTALATWVHSYMEKAPHDAPRARTAGNLPEPDASEGDALVREGHAVYENTCARCHALGRSESSGAALPLQKAVALYDPDPRSLIHIVRDGIEPPNGEPARWMPAFGAILTDRQTAALAAYLRRYGAGKDPWDHIEDSVRKAKQP